MNKIFPTPYPELNNVLQDLVERAQKILSENFIGACLQGSFAVGDFDIHSDVDFINRFYQTYIVLNFCRMLHDLHNGFPGSKLAGSEWAKVNLDPSWNGLIDRAWSGRPNPAVSVRQPSDPEDFQSTLKFIQYVISKSKQFAITK